MKVVLLGDSIRMGYQPLVIRKFEEAEVWGPPANCRHSLWTLDHFDQWVANQDPDIVHVNFGIHDCSIQADGEHRGQHCVLQDSFQILMQQPGAKDVHNTASQV